MCLHVCGCDWHTQQNQVIWSSRAASAGWFLHISAFWELPARSCWCPLLFDTSDERWGELYEFAAMLLQV